MASLDLKLSEIEIFAAFDTETTGVNVFTDRIVSVSLIREPVSKDYQSVDRIIVNPGVSIPPEATAIHGITDEMVQAEGEDPKETVEVIRDLIWRNWDENVPIVGCNLAYDLSIFDAECQRYGLGPFEVTGPVLDIMVLHRMTSGLRKATLDKMCDHYRVTNEYAHTSYGDCKATLDIMMILMHHHEIRNKTLRELYTMQRQYHRQWGQSLQDWFDRKGINQTVDYEWPKKNYDKENLV